MTYPPDTRPPAWMPYWLLLMVGMVLTMIIVGGITRLTNSGLSITEWAPIRGALPPMSDAAWASEFEKYKQIPEFSAEHPDMDLEGFKFIYFWEWFHRLLGRFVGLVWMIPLIILTVRKRLPKGRGLKLWGVGVLIGIQGAIGWWMVHSGLQEGMVAVSQYRLATHLGMAFLLLGILFWFYLLSIRGWPDRLGGQGGRLSRAIMGLTFVQIVLGAFVAGTSAGKTYNTWPLMDGDFVPAGYFIMDPAWRNLFENVAAIQFNHRMLAYILLVVFSVAVWVYRKRSLKLPILILGALLAWQVIMGIWTLLAVVPLSLALKHQFTAGFVFLASVWLHFRRRELR